MSQVDVGVTKPEAAVSQSDASAGARRVSGAATDEPETAPPVGDVGGSHSDTVGHSSTRHADSDDENLAETQDWANAAESQDAAAASSLNTDGDADHVSELSAELANELARVRAERDGYLSDLQRMKAEFANFRRQTSKRNNKIVAQAASKLAESLLPVLDAFEAAVSQDIQGVETLQAQLLGVLEGQGLTVIGAVDESFDPNRHEAVTFEPPIDADDSADHTGPVVAAVLRAGYAWKTRVLRPAMVRVRG